MRPFILMIAFSISLFGQTQKNAVEREGELFYSLGVLNAGQIVSLGWSFQLWELNLGTRVSSFGYNKESGTKLSGLIAWDWLIGYQTSFREFNFTVSSGLSLIDINFNESKIAFAPFSVVIPLDVKVQKVLLHYPFADFALGINAFHYIGLDEGVSGIALTGSLLK